MEKLTRVKPCFSKDWLRSGLWLLRGGDALGLSGLRLPRA